MILLDKNRIERTLKRMAYQILEEAHNDSIHLVGINQRGMAVATKIQFYLEKASGNKIPITQLESDRDSTIHLTGRPKDEILVIVDDVIFSGGTVFHSINRIGNLSEFNNIIVAVLVDRGHRKYPIQAGIVGFHFPTKLNEHVAMTLKDNQPEIVQLSKH